MKLRKQCVVSISYFNYLFSIGGTDKFIVEQKEYFYQNGYDYIHIYSTNFLMNKLHLPNWNKWAVMINDRLVGVFSEVDLSSYLKEIDLNTAIKFYIVNHMKNINTDILENIFYNKSVPIYIFIHDYYTLCPHSGLIDDSGIYCERVKQDTDCPCHGINHGYEDKFADNFYNFLKKEKERVSVFFPSEVAKRIWLLAYSELSDKCIILPHYKIIEWKKLAPRAISNEISVAYVGNDKPHKGYQKWKNFVKQVQDNNTIKLYHFGTCNDKLPNVTYVDIDYSKEEKKLTNKLLDYKIDCVVLWSLVPETYSYTYYEAYSADCFVLTNKLSGNIAKQTEVNGNGFVSEDINGLFTIVGDYESFRKKLEKYFDRDRKIPLKMENNHLAIHCFDDNSSYSIPKRKISNLFFYRILEQLYKMIRYARRKISK